MKVPQEQAARAYFDERASKYRAELYEAPLANHYQLLMRRRREIVEQMLGSLRGPSLELGCGPGVFIDALSRIGAVFPADLSFPMVRQARDAAGVNTGTQLSAAALPFQSGVFSVVTVAGVLEYVPDEGAVLREVHRVLKPGGSAIVTFPAAKPIEHGIRRAAGSILRHGPRRSGASRPEGEHSFAEARRILEREGFAIDFTISIFR
jgi:ubiquinone/menaquinone biosynthesis C-methylase UbiE